jgi:DNA-directed RNA polymerase alpha subunit
MLSQISGHDLCISFPNCTRNHTITYTKCFGSKFSRYLRKFPNVLEKSVGKQQNLVTKTTMQFYSCLVPISGAEKRTD